LHPVVESACDEVRPCRGVRPVSSLLIIVNAPVTVDNIGVKVPVLARLACDVACDLVYLIGLCLQANRRQVGRI